MTRLRRWVPLVAGLAAIAIALFSAVAVNRIRALDRESVKAQLQANLAAASNLLHILQENELETTAAIVKQPELIRLVRAQSANPGDTAMRSALDAWAYAQQVQFGFKLYTIYSSDGTILAAHDPVFVGAKSHILPRMLPMLRKKGYAISAPFRARRVSNQAALHGARDYEQAACRTIVDRAAVLGYFCVGSDPRKLLFPLLAAVWSGNTGEAMLIDRDAHMRTPSRFEPDFEGNPQALQDVDVSRLYARVPTRRSAMPGKLPLPRSDDPPTQMARALLASKAGGTGFMDGYLDYRGIQVVGMGQWLDDPDLGLIIEIDESEAYRAADLAALWVWGLAATSVAFLLLLSIRDAFSRRELERSEARLASFFSNAPVTMYLQSTSGKFLKTNSKFDEMVREAGEPPNEEEDDGSGERTDFQQARDRERNQVLIERKPMELDKTFIDHLGQERFIHVVRFPISVPGSEVPIGVGTISVDLTSEIRVRKALKRMADQLESEVAAQTVELVQARDAAEAAGRAKADFLANMSHEIRTPLNAITGMSHLAHRMNADPRIGHYLQRIDAASAHLLGIVNQILDFSKIEADKIELEIAAFSIEQVLQDVVALIGPKAGDKRLELLLGVDDRVPLRLVGDAMRLGQILINFAANAVKFTDEGCVELRVTCIEHDASDALLRFEVEDSGHGIPADKLAQLFQPFTQADNTRSRSHEGTGLGLAISKRLAELMGGRTSATSRVGKGSTFSLELRLPVAAEPVPEISTPFVSGLRAMIVDDHDRAGAHTQALLFKLGVHPDLRANPRRALMRIASADAAGSPYDLLVIDTDLGEFDGTDLDTHLLRLGLRSQRPAIIHVAAVGDVASGGAGITLRKPLLLSGLRAAIANALSCVTMPPAAAVATKDAPPPLGGGLEGRRILLVEDNEINREVATDLLNIEGIEVVSACDGMQALHRLREGRFDLVLMDLHMPVMDGIEATRAIRRDSRLSQLPVVGLSASVQPADRARALAAGMNAFVGKPIVPAELFAAISQWSINRDAQAPAPARPAATQLPQRGTEDIIQALRTHGLLDVDRAIGLLLGRAELYAKLVRKVVQENACNTDALKSALGQGADADAARQAHNLASIAGSLGDATLRHACLTLEEELRGARPSAEQIELVCAGVESLGKALVAAVNMAEV